MKKKIQEIIQELKNMKFKSKNKNNINVSKG